MNGHRLAAAVAVVVVVAGATSACAGGTTTVAAPSVVGPSTGAITVLIDTRAVPAIRCAIRPFLRGNSVGIRFGGGVPDKIAMEVKEGHYVDVVILPSGPALNRVRNELATPPAHLAVASRTSYWVGAVTNKGLAFARFLTGPQGRAVLSSHSCARTVAPS